MNPLGIAYVRGGGQKCPEEIMNSSRLWIRGIRLYSLVVVDSHLLTGGTTWGRLSLPAADVLLIVERCQTIRRWRTLLNDDINSCRHTVTVKLQSVLQLCSRCVGCLALRFQGTSLCVLDAVSECPDEVKFAATVRTWWSQVFLWEASTLTHHRQLLVVLSSNADIHFTVRLRVGGWVDLGGWLHTEMVYRSGHPSKY